MNNCSVYRCRRSFSIFFPTPNHTQYPHHFHSLRASSHRACSRNGFSNPKQLFDATRWKLFLFLHDHFYHHRPGILNGACKHLFIAYSFYVRIRFSALKWIDLTRVCEAAAGRIPSRNESLLWIAYFYSSTKKGRKSPDSVLCWCMYGFFSSLLFSLISPLSLNFHCCWLGKILAVLRTLSNIKAASRARIVRYCEKNGAEAFFPLLLILSRVFSPFSNNTAQWQQQQEEKKKSASNPTTESNNGSSHTCMEMLCGGAQSKTRQLAANPRAMCLQHTAEVGEGGSTSDENGRKNGKKHEPKTKANNGGSRTSVFPSSLLCSTISFFSLSVVLCYVVEAQALCWLLASVSSMELYVEHFHVIVSRERHRGASRGVQVKSNSMAQRATMTSLIKRQFCRPHDQNAYQFLWMKIEKFPIEFQRYIFFLLLFWLLIEVSVNRLWLSIAVWTESPSSLPLGMSKIVLDTLFLVLVVAEWRSIKTQFSS